MTDLRKNGDSPHSKRMSSESHATLPVDPDLGGAVPRTGDNCTKSKYLVGLLGG